MSELPTRPHREPVSFYYVERVYSREGALPGPGCCCGTGCLLLLIVAALALKGLISLF
jgi:hypothetical protein